ncbi:NACHT domain-containing protein [Pseudomonas plecoglossicida]
MPAIRYFSRFLRKPDEQGQMQIVDDTEILAIAGPKVVLGEPGMGKSELIRELGRRLDVQPVDAIRFMHSKDPSRFVVAGKPLLIDALDEAVARHEGDAVDSILAQLEDAGSPEFILSCRAREWQSRSANRLRQIYGVDPIIFSLEALNRAEATSFLEQRYPTANAEHVISHLEAHGIADLYGNPLTLGLMGQVAEYDAQLPATRAALFERVCTLIWPEHDRDRHDLGLGKIAADQALSAAGAIMAGLLLSGAEAVNLVGPMRSQDNDVRLVDLELLPEAGAAQVIIASKLFQSVGAGRAKPIHRVIAEFLGARWLAQQATAKRAQRRLLAQFHGAGAVPASLRGLHAWLAFHSTAMAPAVIAADPIGVLRYGETDNLTSEHADCLLGALESLAEIDPYFGAQDWDSHSAKGLMIPNLRTKIEAIICSTESNGHLRAVLISGLKDMPLARDLADTLAAVTLSTERFYRERQDAASALMPYRDRAWWQQTIANLRIQGTADSTRLARNLIQEFDCDVPDELLVETLLAEMGLTICPLPSDGAERVHTYRHYGLIVDLIPAARLTNVISLLADHVSLVDDSDWQGRNDLAEIVALLMVRAIDEKKVSPCDAAALWGWLGTFKRTNASSRTATESLKLRLEEHDALRRSVQLYALYGTRPRPTIWMSQIDLNERFVGLAGRPKDVTWFLERLSGADNKDQGLREDWQDLMHLGFDRDGFDPDLRAASRQFQAGDGQLEAFVHKLQNPKKPGWKLKQERNAVKQERKKRIDFETRRRLYAAKRAELRAGELAVTLDPAKVYLGVFYDLDREQPPIDRLVEWFGSELGDDAMAGFEAVLHRSDIPTSAEVAQSFADSKRWNYCFAIMAGLLARQQAGRGFTDLSAEVRTTGLLLCHDSYCMCESEDLPLLRDTLEQAVVPSAKEREYFARLWMEPSLAARNSYVSDLYKLSHDEHWQPTVTALASEWLIRFPNIPLNVEEELIDCLTHSGALAPLASVAAARHSMIFRNIDHLYTWLAVDVLVRFDMVLPDLSGIGVDHPEFIWALRDRFQLGSHGAILRVSIAQAKWIVSQFRTQWPHTVLSGSGSGDNNSYNATDFLRAMINRIADDTSVEASEAMQALVTEPSDTYSDQIRHMAAEQRQKCAEEDFAPVFPINLAALLTERPPSNADDLKSLVLEELAIAQKILSGDDLDQVRDFWGESGVPYDENRCRDRLAALIGPELQRYGIQRITEADMPNTKRADLAFACSQLQLPMEVKGQWHPEVWQAATEQLDLKYLIDWRSEQRGIYCVFWFGDLPSKSGRRLQVPPKEVDAPTSADEMRKLLIEIIPEARRAMIDVVVLDLTAGKPKVKS